MTNWKRNHRLGKTGQIRLTNGDAPEVMMDHVTSTPDRDAEDDPPSRHQVELKVTNTNGGG